MKKILILALLAFLLWLVFFSGRPANNPLYLTEQVNLVTPPPARSSLAAEAEALVGVINRRNAKIKTYACDDVAIQFSQRMRVRISGTIALEKEKRFRMKIRSVLGQEMDLGSNDSHFWFWSRRMDPPYLHYAKHEDLNKAMLKTPLNPNWLMASLNLGSVNVEGVSYFRHHDYLGLLHACRSAAGENVTIVSLLSPKDQAVIGHYLYDSRNKLTASSEVKSFQHVGEHVLPKELFIVWYEEGISLTWNISQPRLNTSLSADNWVMPSVRNAIDLGKD